jgi:hypothetical protein
MKNYKVFILLNHQLRLIISAIKNNGIEASFHFAVILSISIILNSCDKDEVVPQLVSKAGENQNASINTTVTLDGTSSSGPADFTYSWTYQGDVPESEINFQNKDTSSPTFVPPLTGIYTFTLTISSGGKSDSDQTTVFVEGIKEIGGTLPADLQLKNIQSNSSIPDYLVTSDLIVPDGILLSIVDDGVIIAFEANTGIIVQDGGSLSNVNANQDESFETEFIGDDGWKGILVQNGTLELEQSIIKNAGSGIFNNQDEAGAVILSGTQTNLISFTNNEFINSSSYDILVTDKFPETFRAVKSNTLSYTVPIKAPITFLGFWDSENRNILPEIYDYVHLIPSGPETKDVIDNVNGFAFHLGDAKFFIDGDFWAGSSVSFDRGTTIYIKENSGILPDEGLISFGEEGEMITFTGFENKNWKGIAHRERRVSLKFTKIENAGYGLISIGDFQANEQAAIYSSNITNIQIEDSEILNSGGYGYYNELSDLVEQPIVRTLFKNTAKAAIRINLASVNLVIRKDHGNIFEMNQGVASVELTEAELTPKGQIYSLGNGNYYLVNTDWKQSIDLTINAGVHMKFKSGRYFLRGSNPSVTYFVIDGEENNPVIFEGEMDTPGSWGGLMLVDGFRINHLIIKNGGEFVVPEATERANIISAYIKDNIQSQTFTNSQILNSGGWGVVVESGTLDYGFDDPEKNNLFSDNAGGNVIVK